MYIFLVDACISLRWIAIYEDLMPDIADHIDMRNEKSNLQQSQSQMEENTTFLFESKRKH
jgi:hypothetical protein